MLLQVALLQQCMQFGYGADEIYDFFKKYAKNIKYFDVKNILKLVSGLIIKKEITITGLTNGNKLENYIKEKCAEKGVYNIKQIKFPLYITSVDLMNGDIYFFTNSKCPNKEKLKLVKDIEICKAVRASCSFPGIFEPVKWNGTELIDGGIRENIPWKVLKDCGCDEVISVVFKNKHKKDCDKNMISVIDSAKEYLSDELLQYEISGSDNIIEVETSGINLLDYSKVDYLYRLGYEMAMKKIKTF